jgi:protein MPE1
MSHVYYKFKSQKDPSRVVFDGPSISVFDLKREIIQLNKLGSGTDFDLSIYDESTNEGIDAHGEAINPLEYTDDNAMIPRATSIIVRRLPPAKPGKGTAVKYVTGIVGHTRSSRHENPKRNEVTAKQSSIPKISSATVNSRHVLGSDFQGDDESAAIAKMMSAQSANWDTQQEKMSHANPVYTNRKKPPLSIPDKPPPQGYICHRCGEKGHWIQACPTNDDPQFDNKPRIKRTTGIPKTFLKKAEKPVFEDDVEAKTNGVMLDADGEYVVVEPDSRSWATYQAKQNAAGDADVWTLPVPAEHRGWECGVCGRLARDAVRTPCCKTLFCDEHIQSALLEADFVCPSCGTNDVLLDSLVSDEGVRAEIKEYVARVENERAKSASPPPGVDEVKREGLSPSPASRKRSRSPAAAEETSNKKVATEDAKSPNPAKATLATAGGSTASSNPQFNQFQQQQFNNMPPFMHGMPPMPFPPFPPDPFMMAAMGLPPPPLPGMMPPMPPMPGMFPPQGFNQQGFNQGYNQMGGNQMYGGNNQGYMRGPGNGRGMGRVQRGGPHGRGRGY